MLKICLHGAGGRMGRALVAAITASSDCQIVAAIEAPGSSLQGVDVGALCGLGDSGVAISSDLPAALAHCDAVIDFSGPPGTAALVAAVAQAAVNKPICVITGTTGLDAAQQQCVTDLAAQVPLIQAANFSIGVNLCVRLSELAAVVMDQYADVEIIEAHHRDKVDAPSGTALRLGQAVADATGRSLAADAVKSRDGHTGPRPARAIGFSTIRGGDIIGDHTVMFAAQGERVEITHRASSRQNFAAGALAAARWLQGRSAGQYEMTDVLGLKLDPRRG